MNLPHSVRARLSPPVKLLSAGPWSARLVGDELAHISYAGQPVLRAIKAVVRDHNWGTVPPSLDTVEVSQGDKGMDVRWSVTYAGAGIHYDGSLTAKFTTEAVEVGFTGKAVQAFQSNRIGLVVLHPPTDAGKDITVDHTDGSKENARFPVDISPHQPFMDIAALEWRDAGTGFRLSFSGDVFETEDQRNWTDASFKTYSTPLSRPFPRNIGAGDTVQQSIRLEASPLTHPTGAHTYTTADGGYGDDKPHRIQVTLGSSAGRVPGLALAAASPQHTPAVIPGLEGLLVELVETPGVASVTDWAAKLRAAADYAAGCGAGLDIRVVSSTPARTIPDLAPFLPRTIRLAAFHPASHATDPDTWQEFTEMARAAGFTGSFLAGARSHFTELNRNSSRLPDGDALTFSITPQMHSTETAHIIDSVPMQALTAKNARRLGKGKPLHIGPVTLLPRFNAVATSADASVALADELQNHPFTAAWTVASIAALTLHGVESITYYTASGPAGATVVEGVLNPAGQVIKEIAGHRGNSVLGVELETDLPVTVYPIVGPEGLTIFTANLSPSTVELAIDNKTVLTAPRTASTTLEPYTAGILRFTL
ncbi:hypothetical protein ACIPWF_10310 [Paenarthrobacter sp. NPDC089989]|uniref:hypothetical protein n=1 Tax=unclassified Paenarthrobacter TaxID=2634190 RepID=UPI0037F28DAF